MGLISNSWSWKSVSGFMQSTEHTVSSQHVSVWVTLINKGKTGIGEDLKERSKRNKDGRGGQKRRGSGRGEKN